MDITKHNRMASIKTDILSMCQTLTSVNMSGEFTILE